MDNTDKKKVKFKIGDYVRANNYHYGVTNRDMIRGEVIEAREDGSIRLKIIDHSDEGYCGDEFEVEAKYFYKLDEPKDTSTKKDSLKTPMFSMEYDEERQVGFITFGERVTACVPCTEREFYNIGISKRHNDDDYNEEIGRSLAYYRTKQ